MSHWAIVLPFFSWSDFSPSTAKQAMTEMAKHGHMIVTYPLS
ncbi:MULTISPECIES: hypothetical protein [unclassified Colwellia]|nr:MULTISPECIES: hypothetical protein [unclassified Colwellia]